MKEQQLDAKSPIPLVGYAEVPFRSFHLGCRGTRLYRIDGPKKTLIREHCNYDDALASESEMRVVAAFADHGIKLLRDDEEYWSEARTVYVEGIRLIPG